jgi:hypothetical protein
MKKTLISISFAMATFTALPAHAAGDGIVSSTIEKKALLKKEYMFRGDLAFSGDLVQARKVMDRDGEHLLILTSLTGPSKDEDQDQRVNGRTDLRARYFSRSGGSWSEEWNIRDFVDCPNRDWHAFFAVDNVTVTDVNHDGVAEITVPYLMTCGGGANPSTVKVIMRQGAEKYALRGESLVRIPGQAPLGGTYRADKDLDLPRNAAFREQLYTVWQQVYKMRMPN